MEQHEFNVPVWVDQQSDFIGVKGLILGPQATGLARMVHAIVPRCFGLRPRDVNATVGPDAGIKVNHLLRRFEDGLFDPAVVVVDGHEHGRGIVVGVNDDRARLVVGKDLHPTCSVRGVHLNLIRHARAMATVVRVGFVEPQLHVTARESIG